jgi:hypothetical protein
MYTNQEQMQLDKIWCDSFITIFSPGMSILRMFSTVSSRVLCHSLCFHAFISLVHHNKIWPDTLFISFHTHDLDLVLTFTSFSFEESSDLF